MAKQAKGNVTPYKRKVPALPKKGAAFKSLSEGSNVLMEDDVYDVTAPAKVGISSIFTWADTMLLGLTAKPENQLTPFEKIGMIKEGISKKSLEKLKATTTLDYDQLAEALTVTRATLINKKGNEKFSTSLSERIVSLADIYAYGYEVFEDRERFNEWMFKPTRALGGQTPYSLMDNHYGREEVRNLIGRIDYGVFS